MTRQDFLNMVVLTKKLAKKTGFTDEVIAITAAELEQKYERFNKERFLNACYAEEKKGGGEINVIHDSGGKFHR